MSDQVIRLTSALEGRYRIERELGMGGMAVVYLAEDLKHHRRVAIKVMRPELSAAMGPQRFLREIEIAAQLNHPNILGLHDSGEADGLLYFVMPFVEGQSLRERLNQEGQLSLDDAVQITCEVASALGYAHEQGLVHRDIKPENVLFQAGHALVCDFGIAKAASEAEGRLTQTGLAVGTLKYMSPEQAAGEYEIDGRADLYALACVLQEMLSGEVPFAGPTPQAVLARKLMGVATDLSTVRPVVPPTVRHVISRALAPSPDDRFATAEALSSALAHATTESAVAEDARRRRRSRMWRSVAMLAGVTTVGAGGWWMTAVVGGPAIERIALLPLTNTQRDTAQDFFVQGVYNDLVKEFTQAGIHVINSRGYVGTDLRIRDIAAELNVDGVVEGSVTLEGDRIEVELRLSDGVSELQLWIESFEAPVSEVMSLYHNVTLAIADEIETVLSSEALARLAESRPVDPEVRNALYRAQFYSERLNEEALNTAMSFYERALDLDSTSVEAWMGVAEVWSFRTQQGLVSPETATRQAAAAMQRATALDPTLSDDPAALALQLTWPGWNWPEGEGAFIRAIVKDSTDAQNLAYYSQLLFYLGRRAEAIERMDQAAAMGSLNFLVMDLITQDHIFLRRYAEAEQLVTRQLNRDPGNSYPLGSSRTIYHLTGDFDKAIEYGERYYRVKADDEAADVLVREYDQNGYAAAYEAVAELFIARKATGDTLVYVPNWQIATLYTRAENRERALEYLQMAYGEKEPNMPSISVDPIFDFLEQEPRFLNMLSGLGLTRLEHD